MKDVGKCVGSAELLHLLYGLLYMVYGEFHIVDNICFVKSVINFIFLTVLIFFIIFLSNFKMNNNSYISE